MIGKVFWFLFFCCGRYQRFIVQSYRVFLVSYKIWLLNFLCNITIVFLSPFSFLLTEWFAFFVVLSRFIVSVQKSIQMVMLFLYLFPIHSFYFFVPCIGGFISYKSKYKCFTQVKFNRLFMKTVLFVLQLDLQIYPLFLVSGDQKINLFLYPIQ